MLALLLLFGGCTWGCESVCERMVGECGLSTDLDACLAGCEATREEATSWEARACALGSDCGEVLRGDCAIISEHCSGMNHLLVYRSDCVTGELTLTIDEVDCDYTASGASGWGEFTVDVSHPWEPVLQLGECEIPVDQDVSCPTPEGGECLVSGRRLL